MSNEMIIIIILSIGLIVETIMFILHVIFTNYVLKLLKNCILEENE